MVCLMMKGRKNCRLCRVILRGSSVHVEYCLTVYHEQHMEALTADPLEHIPDLAHTLMLTGYVTGNVSCVSKH
jgi:hypothetical protein